MIFVLFFTLCLTSSAFCMESVSKAQEGALVQVQLHDVRMCIQQDLAKALTASTKAKTVADGALFLPLAFAEWKMVEPYFKLVVAEPNLERLKKKAQRLCNTMCGKQLGGLRTAGERIHLETLLVHIENAEKRLNTIGSCTLNDNDIVPLITSDWIKVRLCWRLASLSKTLKQAVCQSEGGSLEHITLKMIDSETWKTIRALFAFYYRLQKKGEGESAIHATKKIEDLIASLDETRLMKLLIGINYLDVPPLFVRVERALQGKKIDDSTHEAILKLPSAHRNQVISKALVHALDPISEVSQTTHTCTLQDASLVSVACAAEGSTWACFVGKKDEMHVIDLSRGDGFKRRMAHYPSMYLIRNLPQEKFVTANSDMTFTLWACSGCEQLKVYGEPSYNRMEIAQANDMCLGVDGRLYTCHLDGCVRIWHEDTGKAICKLVADDYYFRSNILSLCLMHDGKPQAKIAAGSVTGAVLIWDMHEGKFLYVCDDEDKRAEPVYALCSSENGYVYAGSCDGMVRVWDSNDGKLIQRWKLEHRICAINGDLKGTVICALANGIVCVADSLSGTVLMRCGGEKGWISSLGLSQKMKLFACFLPDGSVREYDLAILKALQLMNLEQASEILRLLQLLKDGQDKPEEQPLSWAIVRNILGCQVLPPSKPEEVSPSCILQ